MLYKKFFHFQYFVFVSAMILNAAGHNWAKNEVIEILSTSAALLVVLAIALKARARVAGSLTLTLNDFFQLRSLGVPFC